MPTYRDVAPAYLENNLWPIPVKQKRPPVAGSTGANGVVTPEKVRQWMADYEWGFQNMALRHDGTVAIDVDDYSSKTGAAELHELEAKLGPLPATVTSTARGKDTESRQHFFILRDDIRLVSNASPSIEIIQRHHRYSLVWPSVNPAADGATYWWYDADGEPFPEGEIPTLDQMEYLPDAWVEYLAVEDREYEHTGEQWEGDLPEAASEHELRKLRTIASNLVALPEVWRPGAGWHDTVFNMACWLARIARSNAYALAKDQALDLLLQNTPTYPEWGPENIVEQWESAWKSTEGQFEEPPIEDRPPFLPWTGFPSDRPFPPIGNEDFPAVWGPSPTGDETSGALWSRRHKMLVALLRADFTEQEAATFVWHSGAARVGLFTFDGESFEDADSRCISEKDLWREVDQAKDEIAHGSGATVDAAPANERPRVAPPQRVSLLSDAERTAATKVNWFGRRYCEWARSTFSFVNMPYYRLNRWTILSVIFSPYGVMARPGGIERSLNLYMVNLGLTTSGKTEALSPVESIFKMFYNVGSSPVVGGNFTPESLIELLIDRDGESTWFKVDEAHTKIAQWKKPAGPYSEMPGVITDIYDGRVGAIHRATKKEISGRSARAFVTAYLMGTPQGMADVMGPDDWESGFLSRFVWAIGDQPVETPESVAGDWLTDDELDADAQREVGPDGYPMFRQWCSEFDGAVSRVARPDEKPNRMRFPGAVLARHKEVAWRLTAIAQDHPNYLERLRPTFRRLGETILRCACLVALSDGRIDVKMSDLLVAIEQAEEWVTNILIMVEATDETLRTRHVNFLERSIISAGGVMTKGQIYRLPRFKSQRRYVDELLGELIAQGRVGEDKNKDGIAVIQVKGIPA